MIVYVHNVTMVATFIVKTDELSCNIMNLHQGIYLYTFNHIKETSSVAL